MLPRATTARTPVSAPRGLPRGLEIRAYRESDEALVGRLWRAVFPESSGWNIPEQDIARKLTVQPDLFLVACFDSSLVGTAMGGYDGHRGWAHLVAVHPDFRRRGVGAGLMRRLEEALGALGCPKVNLQVRSGNETVIEFYRKLGYTTEERVSMGKRLA